MKVLHVAPINVPIKPKEGSYGGLEEVVGNMDRYLTAQGHDSYVAAPADSDVYGTLVPTLSSSLWSRGEGTKLDSKAEYERHSQAVVDSIKCLTISLNRCSDRGSFTVWQGNMFIIHLLRVGCKTTFVTEHSFCTASGHICVVLAFVCVKTMFLPHVFIICCVPVRLVWTMTAFVYYFKMLCVLMKL